MSDTKSDLNRTKASKLRDAMSDVEFMLLEQGLQADAQFIADLTKQRREDEAQEYIRSSRFLERRDAWRQGRTP
jgi:hypothetical protein